jgi:hypothetical protein
VTLQGSSDIRQFPSRKIVISVSGNDYAQETQGNTIVESHLSVKVMIKQTKKAHSDIKIGVYQSQINP